jgi:3',5'-cyclic-AMP phosphodiesterase
MAVMFSAVSRRKMIKSCAVTVAAAMAGGLLVEKNARGELISPPPVSASPRRVLRFAHPTDIHVQPELRSAQGMAAAFRHMMALEDPPRMILVGGDLPLDVNVTPFFRSAQLWSLYRKTLEDNVPPSVPIHHAIGNHDIWGLDKQACRATGTEAFFGKKWFLDEFGYSSTYYSFNMAGWHFIVLDSIVPDGTGRSEAGFSCRIAGDQLDWLKSDLSSTPPAMPVVVVSHVPIISAATFFERRRTMEPDIVIGHRRMHSDYETLNSIFLEHRNVKLCLSGHLHLLDRTEYDGVTYICDGAVCGDFWKGPTLQTPEGYGLIDLFDDGSFNHRYMTYGWRASGA